MAVKFGAETTSEEVLEALASEIKDKVVIITGCTWGGIGAENARVVAKGKAKLVVITGRSEEKLKTTIENIKKETPDANIRPLIMDLTSLKSVRHAAAEVNSYPENIDVLINNAGVMATPYGKTEDGFETQFATNHLAHFLFTNLILKKILASENPRIINVSSLGHALAPIIFEDPGFSNGKTYIPWLGYGQSKTANILFSRELSRRYNKTNNLVTFSLHPGSIFETDLGKYVKFSGDVNKIGIPADYWGNYEFATEVVKEPRKTLSQGGATTLVAAFDPSIKGESGSYLIDCQLHEELCCQHAKQPNYAFKLWNLSNDLVGESF